MKKRVCCVLAAAALALAGCSNAGQHAGAGQPALVPEQIAPNNVARNPYMSDSENSVHNDSYSSDVTAAVLPLGINSRVSTSLETQNPQAPSAAFYDADGNMITPFNGGVAIADLTGDTIARKGVFVPSMHDSQSYRVQISYSFVDADGNIVLPTSHGHVIVLQTKDENGDVLPVFKKIQDMDVVGLAEKELGEDIDKNLLSIVYDYEGNLWFVTGGFRIDPETSPAGFLGYISPEGKTYFHRLADGEGAENGISSGEQGAVILTNMACYLLRADDGVDVVWRTAYETNGARDAEAGSGYTGGGLAYGSGTTPTLTRDLVLFTDNQDPISLLALSEETGEVVASMPVLDDLESGTPVSVENSILVYSGDPERTSVIVCNWFGAGNAGLADPDADSSVQSYANLYDPNWLAEGNAYIAPGVERVDIVRTAFGYRAEKVWSRDDIRDTSMIKLSTATGYLYGYWQNLETGMWCYEVLDFDTGETVLEVPVSSFAEYNNVAVGMIPDVGGNALYCPTNDMEMACWQDSFVYLPEAPAKQIQPHDMGRHALTEEEFAELSGSDLERASYLMTAQIDNLPQETDVVFLLNGLNGASSDYTLFYEGSDGRLHEYEDEWSLDASNGETWTNNAAQVKELRLGIADGADTDTNAEEKNVGVSVILARN